MFGDGWKNEATTPRLGGERTFRVLGDNKGRGKTYVFGGVCGLRRIKGKMKKKSWRERGRRCAGEGSFRQKKKREVVMKMWRRKRMMSGRK